MSTPSHVVTVIPGATHQCPTTWPEQVIEQTITIDQRLYTLYSLIAQHHGVAVQALMQDVLYKSLEEEKQGIYQACQAQAAAADKRIKHMKEHHGL